MASYDDCGSDNELEQSTWEGEGGLICGLPTPEELGSVPPEREPEPDLGIEIVIKQDNEIVDSQILVGFKPSEELRERMNRMTNPHYVVVVASVTEEDRYGIGEPEEFLTPRSITFTSNPYEFVKFSRSGANRIFVTVTDIRNREARQRVNRTAPRDFIRYNNEFDTSYANLSTAGLGMRNVHVPAAAFSKPAQWKVDMVKRFWRGSNEDDCHLRKKLYFGAIPLAIFIQLLGIVLRPAAFVAAAVMLKRDMRLAHLRAFNPLGAWTMSGDPWWYVDRNGKDRMDGGSWRSGWPAVFNPLTLGTASAVMLGIPAIIDALVKNPELSYWEIVGWTGIVILGAIGVFILVAFIKNRIDEWYTERKYGAITPVAPPRGFEVPESGLDWDDIPEDQKTVRLRFTEFKSRVCRPIEH